MSSVTSTAIELVKLSEQMNLLEEKIVQVENLLSYRLETAVSSAEQIFAQISQMGWNMIRMRMIKITNVSLTEFNRIDKILTVFLDSLAFTTYEEGKELHIKALQLSN